MLLHGFQQRLDDMVSGRHDVAACVENGGLYLHSACSEERQRHPSRAEPNRTDNGGKTRRSPLERINNIVKCST